MEKQGELDRRDDTSTPKYTVNEMMVDAPPNGPSCPTLSTSPITRFQERFSSETSEVDPWGDGDQSPVTEPADQALYLELFRTGGDFDEYLPKSVNRQGVRSFSDFASHCISGRYEKVKQILENNSPRRGKPWKALQQLLERRETILRLSPLLLVFCMMYKIGIVTTSRVGNANECNETIHTYRSGGSILAKQPSKDTENTGRRSLHGLKKEQWMQHIAQLEQNLVRVVAELLYYGASPLAKDLCGRTVCFYGASIHATPLSLQATTMCIHAAKSAHCFGKEVMLQNMDTMMSGIDATGKDVTKYKNGMRGLAAGYQVETACRVVYLFGHQSAVAVFNRNICLIDAKEDLILNLCDIPDRLGRVCLTELVASPRIDVINFLLQQHNASIDIPDWKGQTIRKLSAKKLRDECRQKLIPSIDDEVIVAQVIRIEALKRARQEQKRIERTCTACSHIKLSSESLQVCQHCMSVRYCSEECQAHHWKVGGHRKECLKLRKLYNECVTIETPLLSEVETMSSSSFRKPLYAAPDEIFTLKVEIVDDEIEGGSLLHLHDKTKECDYYIGQCMNQTFTKLCNKILAEPSTAGTHAYLSASFDHKGKCRVYLNRRKIKTW